MGIPLLTARSQIAQELYVRALSSLYRQGVRLHDPDFAIQREPDLYEKARRDPVVARGIDARLHGVAGKTWRIIPGGDHPADQDLAQIVEDAIARHLEGFTEARYEQAQAVVRARSYSYIAGQRRHVELGDSPALDWWVPTRLQDVDRRRFRWVPINEHLPDGTRLVRSRLQLFSIERILWENVEHPEFFVKTTYRDEEARLGYGRGLLESIYYYLWTKQELLKEGLQAVKKFARGVVVAKIASGLKGPEDEDNDIIRNAWLDVLAAMQSEQVIVMDRDDEIQVIEGNTKGVEMVLNMVQYLDDAMIALLTGSVLPFGSGAGAERGSFARAKVEQEETDALIQADRDKLDEDWTRDLVGLFLRLNRPLLAGLGLDKAKRPKFSTVLERREDPEKAINIRAQILDRGLPIIESELYEAVGLTPPGDRDDIVRKQDGGSGSETSTLPGFPQGFNDARRLAFMAGRAPYRTFSATPAVVLVVVRTGALGQRQVLTTAGALPFGPAVPGNEASSATHLAGALGIPTDAITPTPLGDFAGALGFAIDASGATTDRTAGEWMDLDAALTQLSVSDRAVIERALVADQVAPNDNEAFPDRDGEIERRRALEGARRRVAEAERALGTSPTDEARKELDDARREVRVNQAFADKSPPVKYADTLAQFNDAERACISEKVRANIAEGKDQDQAVAIAISQCAPEKAR